MGVDSRTLFQYILHCAKSSEIVADRNKCYGQMLQSRDKPILFKSIVVRRYRFPTLASR
jgi:hypothetical protein